MRKVATVKVVSVLAGIAAVMFVAALTPATSYAADTIFKSIVPSETQAADGSGLKFATTPTTHYMDVSESQAVDTTVPGFAAAPSTHYMDVSESQALDTRTDTPAVADKSGNSKKICCK